MSNCPFCLLHKLVHKFQHAFIHLRSVILAAYPIKWYNVFSNVLLEILRLCIINIFILQCSQISLYLDIKSLSRTLPPLFLPPLVLHFYNLVLHLNSLVFLIYHCLIFNHLMKKLLHMLTNFYSKCLT